MSTVPVQCECGQLVQVSRADHAKRERCPSCGAMVRAPARRSTSDETREPSPSDRGSSAEHDLDFDEEGAGYEVAAERDDKADPPSRRQPTGTWVPLRGRDTSGRGQSKTRNRMARPTGAFDLLARVQRHGIDLPGPFFSWSAIFYIFLYPTWVRWLGLSFLSMLAGGVMAVTLFVAWIVIQFQLFLSVFAIASMTMVNLALVSYLVACFVEVIEETAAGEDRLEQLVDMSWWEILPRFFRATGAATVAIAITLALTIPVRPWLTSDSAALLIEGVILLQIFPILLLTNLVDGTVLPLRSLGGTVRRLAAQAGYFAAFQITVALVTALVLIVVDAMHSWHWVAAVAAAGPMAATWFMYYGHWLGRLGRQLAELD